MKLTQHDDRQLLKLERYDPILVTALRRDLRQCNSQAQRNEVRIQIIKWIEHYRKEGAR